MNTLKSFTLMLGFASFTTQAVADSLPYDALELEHVAALQTSAGVTEQPSWTLTSTNVIHPLEGQVLRTPSLQVGETAVITVQFQGSGGVAVFDLSVLHGEGNYVDFLINDMLHTRISGTNRQEGIQVALPLGEDITLTWRYVKQHHTEGTADYAQLEYLHIENDFDRDADGLHDAWEYSYFGHLDAEAKEDVDADHLTNLMEMQQQTHPLQWDTDADQLADGWEVIYNYDPLQPNPALDAHLLRERGQSFVQKARALLQAEDETASLKLFKRAARIFFFADAQYQLGQWHSSPDHGVQSYKRAARFFLQAAQQGHTQAQYALGKAYEHGEGVRKNLTTAITWYQQAANQGHALTSCAYNSTSRFTANTACKGHGCISRRCAGQGRPSTAKTTADGGIQAAA